MIIIRLGEWAATHKKNVEKKNDSNVNTVVDICR